MVTYGWGMIPVDGHDGRRRVDDLALAEGRRLHRAAQGGRAEVRGRRGRRRRRPAARRRRVTRARKRAAAELATARTDAP